MGVNSTKFLCILVQYQLLIRASQIHLRKFLPGRYTSLSSSNVATGNCLVRIAGLTVPLQPPQIRTDPSVLGT